MVNRPNRRTYVDRAKTLPADQTTPVPPTEPTQLVPQDITLTAPAQPILSLRVDGSVLWHGTARKLDLERLRALDPRTAGMIDAYLKAGDYVLPD